ncbi:uncharacterized protein [Antedon mediterranea]|uniref:uncharacterized protein n=1 Tax=Antedon mediterranea TaxID=105859 RepID=UPI003AF8408E
MPDSQGDKVRFVLHQTEKDPNEVFAHIIKEDEYKKLCDTMMENGSTLCEAIKSDPFYAKVDESFIIRVIGDVIIKTFGEHSYRSDRIQLKYLRNRINRRDFYVKGYYRGRYQPEYVGKVMLHRTTIHAGTTNKGSGRQFGMTNLESVIGKVVASASIVLPKALDDPVPEDIEGTEDETKKDIILRTISKDIHRGFAIPLAMHLFGLTETEIFNLNLLPNHYDFNEQRYLILKKWKTQEGENASFEKLIAAFRAVRMTAPAQSLNRNLLTDNLLKVVANALPPDPKKLCDHFKIKMTEVEAKFTDELNEHTYQILSRWKERTHKRLSSARACHLHLLKHLRNIGLENLAKKCGEITSVDTRDVTILRIITKDASRETIFRLVKSLGISQDNIDAITRTFGIDFNKRMFLLNCLVKWMEKGENVTFEHILGIMRSKAIGLKMNAHILDEELISQKRLSKLAKIIDPEHIQSLAVELGVDIEKMQIPEGTFEEAVRFRLLQRWKEVRGKYATHTELISALRAVGLSSVVTQIDAIGSIDTKRGALCDFCLRYVSSWMHVNRAHEWPSIVQNIPSPLVEGLDSKVIDQIQRYKRDPQEQMANALTLCRDRGILPTVAKFVDRLTACGFEHAAKTFLDVARPVLYYSGLRPYEV